MLYPTELSSGGRTGFEPAANGFRRCSTSELPSALETPSRDSRHTRRQSRAHRTGVQEPVPLQVVHLCFALAPRSANPLCDCTLLPPVPKHPGTALSRLRGVPCLGPALSGCFGARCNRVWSIWGFPLCEPQK